MNSVSTGCLKLAISLAIAFAGGATPFLAQAQSQNKSQVFRFDIPASTLSQALARFSEASGIQLVYSSDLVKDLRCAGLSGELSAIEALTQILQGSGLTARFSTPTTASIVSAPSHRSRVLGPVRVEGANSNTELNGINGSTDVTATEGTKSYTSGALSIASKLPQSIKDTPQSVSVITQQRMQDQNLTDFKSMMDQATGVTLVSGGTDGAGSNLETKFYSRGFAVDRIQIDGGAPLTVHVQGFIPLIDMAQYDHVEILRGAAGLFNGYGDPNGSLNLSRKRPLDHSQVILEAQAGSWNHYRTVLDATTPLGFDGRLRGRVVVSYEDREYFYDTANDDHTLVYGIAELDVTSNTVLRGGFSSTRQSSVPWIGGLPRYEDGGDLRLGRGTSFAMNWNRHNIDTQEIFAQADQQLGPDWSLSINLTLSDQQSDTKYGLLGGAVNPVTGAGPALQGRMHDYASLQKLADFTLNGTFELFGHSQHVVLGGNWQAADNSGLSTYDDLYAYPYPAADIFSFDPGAPRYREPQAGELSGYWNESLQKQWGAYANVRLTLWEPLHLITGLRYSHYQFSVESETYCTSTYVAVGLCNIAGELYEKSPREIYQDDDVSWPPTISLVYDLGKIWSIYASYTDVYKSQATYVDRARRPLDPITGSNVEIGLKAAGLAGKFNATLAAYRIEQKHTAVFDNEYEDLGNGITCCYRLGDQVNLSRGVDAELTGELLPGWQLFAGYTFNLNEYQGSDAPAYLPKGAPLVTRMPKHLLKLWTDYRFQDDSWLNRLSIGGGVNAQTESYSAGSACVKFMVDDAGQLVCDYANGGSVLFEFTQGFYAIFSARMAYQLDARWSAALNVNNIADRSYYQTTGDSSNGNWYGEPRSFMLTMRGQF